VFALALWGIVTALCGIVTALCGIVMALWGIVCRLMRIFKNNRINFRIKGCTDITLLANIFLALKKRNRYLKLLLPFKHSSTAF
jgi:hypothetical protein